MIKVLHVLTHTRSHTYACIHIHIHTRTKLLSFTDFVSSASTKPVASQRDARVHTTAHMFVLLAAAAGTMCAAEIAETKYIYATDEHEFLTAAVERARKRVHDAAEAVVQKGDRKNARLEQAQAGLRDAAKRKSAYVQATNKAFWGIFLLGLIFVRLVYTKGGVRLPLALPSFVSAFAGVEGGDARDVNATTAFMLATYGFRAVLTLALGREERTGMSNFSWEEYRKAHAKSFEAFEKDGVLAAAVTSVNSARR